jgi:hypothetical protein
MAKHEYGLAGGAAGRDMAARGDKAPAPAELLTFAARRSGRGVVDIAREAWRLRRGPGRLRLNEYVQFGLYDSARYPAEEKARFLSNLEHWSITRRCCDMTWQAATEDKWLANHILAKGSGVAVPETLAVIDPGLRAYPGTRKIATLDDLRAFVTREARYPLFGKVNRGIIGAGVFQMLSGDAEGVELAGEGRLTLEAFWTGFLGGNSYILQPVVRNHPFFDAFTGSVATVRAVVLVTPTEVRVPVAVLKIPAQGNIADSFWRKGNVACGIDVETGRLVTAKTKTPFETVDHETHPETGAVLIGAELPFWGRVLDLARSCAAVFAPLRYQSMDIAITAEGPVLIEVNTGGGFDLPQLATGKGFLTPEIRAFFEGCGWTFK